MVINEDGTRAIFEGGAGCAEGTRRPHAGRLASGYSIAHPDFNDSTRPFNSAILSFIPPLAAGFTTGLLCLDRAGKGRL